MTTALQALDKTALLIVNPVAGRMQIRRNLTRVIQNLMAGGYMVTSYVTSSRGEATELAEQIGSKYDLLVCAGGDGTLNECISGLAKQNIQVPVGYIPCGSTNDFALTHEIPVDIAKASRAAASENSRAYDIGCFSERFFLHHALFGAFTRMAYSTDQAQKNVLGLGAYLLDGIREFSNLKSISMSLRFDDTCVEGEYVFGAFSTNRLIGEIFALPEDLIAPNDGKLAAVLIKTPKNMTQWDLIVRSLLSGDPQCEMIEILVSDRFQIRTEESVEWSLDGESSGLRTEAELSVKQGFLLLRC